MELLYVLIAFIVGLLLAWIFGQKRQASVQSRLSAREAELEVLRRTTEEALQHERESARRTVENMQKAAEQQQQALQTQYEERLREQRQQAADRQQEQEKRFADRLAEERLATENARKQMAVEFENLSNRLLQEHSKEFSTMSQKSVGELLRPLADNLKDFREKVDKVYETESRQRFSLEEQIKKLVETNHRLGDDANNLARALRGDSKMQGNWGEMILSHILEASGLKEGEHYMTQEVLRDEDGRPLLNEETHSRMQPDVIVHYPGGRDMIIDSKVSLTDYMAYASATSDEERERYLKEHLRSVRRHIDELSTKDYSRYADKAPDFVMMFMPSEPAYLLAMKQAPDLWNEAYNKKVVLMSPTNLITALRLALDLWKREYQAQNVQKIVDRGTKLYEKVASFTESFQAVGGALEKAGDQYRKAFSQLKDGRGSLTTQVEQLRKLGLNPKKRIAASLLPEEEEMGAEQAAEDKE